MAAKQEISIVPEIIREIESYLPDMKRLLRTLSGKSNSSPEKTVQELQRITHTIQGTAAMIQLQDLSKTAALMEDSLEDIPAGTEGFDKQLLTILEDTVNRIASYCSFLQKGETADGAQLYKTTKDALTACNSSTSINLMTVDTSTPADDESIDVFLQQMVAEEESTGDDDDLESILGFTDNSSIDSEVENDTKSEEDDFLALFDTDDNGEEEDESTDDFFQQFADEDEDSEPDTELEMLLETSDNDTEKDDLNSFLSEMGSELDPIPEIETEIETETETETENSGQEAEKEAVPAESSFAIDPELQECFNEEVIDHLDNLARQLNTLSSSITDPTTISEEYREILHSIRRSVHTMKGAAAVIGVEPVAAWGHDFEDFLDWLHDESPQLSPEIVTLMLDGSDLLEKLANDPGVNVDTEINAIQKHFQTIIDECDKEQEPPFKSPAIDPELQECFDEESEGHLDNISRQLNDISSTVTERSTVNSELREKLHSIRRSVHTLKGAAAVIGIEPVASWGHDFEDFLDTLYDESNTISPEGISAMQDGADILEKITTHPAIDVSTDINTLRAAFQIITEDSSTCEDPVSKNYTPQAAEETQTELPEEPETLEEPETPQEHITQSSEELLPAETAETAQPISTDLAPEQVFDEKAWEEVATETVTPIRISASNNRRNKIRKNTLRVGGEKIAALMGLSGDMAINLSGFENSAFSMQSSLTEFDMTLQRLKGIASSLEAGYELASIPHLGASAGESEDELTEEFDPLEMDRYSELHILIRSLNEAVVDLDSIKNQTAGVQTSWITAVDKQRRVISNVQGTVQAMQMTPFSTLGNRLHKTVRESAKTTKKRVRLLIEGASIEMDTHIWDVLADALMHMLRNCVDHGVESAEKRLQDNKAEQATIRINCSRVGSRFLLRLSDDGGGLDYDAIRSRASSLFPDTGIEQMSDRDLGALIFKQGFSVKKEVTLISGRGVGMDVVRDALDQLNGFIEVSSNTGQGTEFLLSMPIVVAQLPALMVMFGKQQFAVPMRDISRVLRLSDEAKSKDTYELNNQSLPLLKPTELLNLERSTDIDYRKEGPQTQNTSLALAVATGGRRGVIVIDAVLGKKNIVFKNLGSHLQNTLCVAGATILGDGSLVPILQTEDLFSRAESAPLSDKQVTRDTIPEERALEILITDDSISIRKVLSNFVTSQGWKPTTAHDGVEAMEKIRDRKPDLILLDIEMPRMNGFEVLQTLRSQSAYRDIPVLMLTSRSAEKYKEKASQLGASGFVTKPFKDDELLSLISGLTTQKPATGQL